MRTEAVRGLLALCALACATCATGGRGGRAPAEGWTTASPGGALSVQVRLRGGALEYRAALAGAELLAWAPLGLVRADDDFTRGLAFVREAHRPYSDEYTLPRGKRARYTARGHEQVLTFASARGARLELQLRVQDDGFAFRYRFPERDGRLVTVTEEATGFQLPPGARATIAPHDKPGGHSPNYESYWHVNVPAGTRSPAEAGWSFPALFAVNGRWLLVTESDLDGGYCAVHLRADAPAGLYRIELAHASEAPADAPAAPSSTLPWTTPWRVVIAGERLATIVESSLVTDLAAPSTIADTSWIQAGRASWSWWSDGASPRSYPRLVQFVDLAASFGWEYSLVDAGWPSMLGGSWQELVRHAADRHVGLLFWYDSGVTHARAGDLMRDPGKRQAELTRIATAGARGVKIDFFESDKQAVVQLYLGILRDAAQRRLLVDFHGATLPRGWERTYPNLITVEAVRGAEYYLFDPLFPEYAPAHNTVQVFTRNAIGPMDYTPVTFRNAKNPHRTTSAHELALSVVFESGVQHFADAPESYRALPEEAQSFLRGVPAAWDETRLLEGEPGKLAVLARRKGRIWYVAGINGQRESKRVQIPLEFMGNGTFDMLLLADDPPSWLAALKRQRNGMDTQSVALAPYGGFAMRLTPLE